MEQEKVSHGGRMAFLAMIAVAGNAGAQGPDARTLAESLFQEARALVAEGRYAQACPKLQESHRLDPGGGTLLNLAVCHEQEGKTASAWGEFSEALGMARRDGRADRIRVASERIQTLEGRLSRLRVDVAPMAYVTSGIEVKIDGVVLPKAAWGTALPIDPGAHVVRASGPGLVAWEAQVVIGQRGDHQQVLVPALARTPEVAETRSGGGAFAPLQREAQADRSVPFSGPRPDAVAGYVVGSLGLAALAIGGVYGIRALDKRSESDRLCPNEACSKEGVAANEEAKRAALVADIGLGAGLVGCGVGLYLLLTASHQRPGRVGTSATWSGSGAGASATVYW